MSTPLSTSIDCLLHKLEAIAWLSPEDRAAIAALPRAAPRYADPRADLILEGEQPRDIRLILDGWACRYKELPDGRRQIVGFCVPGDLCGLDSDSLRRMDHSVGAITRVAYALVTPEAIDSHRQEQVSASIQREWLLNLGQRNAQERVAHLFLELFVRLRAVGLADGGNCDFPITQADIADATGLTSVHVNRTLQQLRRERLINLANKRLTIHDLDGLARVAMFNPAYLHLEAEGRFEDAHG